MMWCAWKLGREIRVLNLHTGQVIPWNISELLKTLSPISSKCDTLMLRSFICEGSTIIDMEKLIPAAQFTADWKDWRDEKQETQAFWLLSSGYDGE